ALAHDAPCTAVAVARAAAIPFHAARRPGRERSDVDAIASWGIRCPAPDPPALLHGAIHVVERAHRAHAAAQPFDLPRGRPVLASPALDPSLALDAEASVVAPLQRGAR